jgi:hypothetical protein
LPFLPQDNFNFRLFKNDKRCINGSFEMSQAVPKAQKLPHLFSAPKTEAPSLL